MTAAIYARVPTRDKGQTNDNQLLELRAFVERLGYPIYREYCDQESGGTAERPQFQQLFADAYQQLFADAYQQLFDVVLFWSLDRFSREGVGEMLNHLSRLNVAGVPFKSSTEEYSVIHRQHGRVSGRPHHHPGRRCQTGAGAPV